MITKLSANRISPHLKCPQELKPWLLAQDSLTEKLSALTANIRVDVLKHDWRASSWWDKYVLNIPKSEVFVREIVMTAGSSKCWYARTVMPKDTYEQKKSLFECLGTNSLGTVLYAADDIQREHTLYYPIDEKTIEYQWIKQIHKNINQILWCRRSIYRIQSHPLYLCEIFLPDMLELLCKR
jgi:chorismate--pyruvate lyase